MTPSQRYHRGLRAAALGIAVFNLLCLLALDVREWLVYFDPTPVRALVWPAFVLALPALPFLLPLNRDLQASPASIGWLAMLSIALVGFESLWLLQIAIGTFFRGPDWNFYWPWEQRIPKFAPLNNVDLSEVFWVTGLERDRRPDGFLTRESPGMVLVGIHLLVVAALALLAASFTRPRIAVWRVVLLTLAVQCLTLVALKVVLRCMFNLKYFITWPEQLLNL